MPAEGRLIMLVGRLHPDKGVIQALDGFARAHRTDPGLHLTIPGDGPAREDLRLQASRLNITGVTHSIGAVRREAVAAWLSAGDALLFSAIRPEGFFGEMG